MMMHHGSLVKSRGILLSFSSERRKEGCLLILQEIDAADKHLWMNIRNKPELNITFINARTRNLFEKVLIKVWTEL